jgi:hypothetical protein
MASFTRSVVLLVAVLLLAVHVDAMVAPSVAAQARVSGQTIGVPNVIASNAVIQGGQTSTGTKRRTRRHAATNAATATATPGKKKSFFF